MTKRVFNKLLALLLVFAMLAPITGYFGTIARNVQAAEATTPIGYVVVPQSAVKIDTPADTTQPKVMSVKSDDATYGKYAGYIFAGWYTDAAGKTPAASGITGEYARFVPADVLSTKVQVTNGIVKNSTNKDYNDKYVMRFVSSVDSKDYSYAGFELSYKDGSGQTVTLASKTYKVFKRINSTTGATASKVDSYEFSPKVLDTKSEYFITAKWPVAVEDINVDYTVKAYWVTKDGTTVYGSERCVSVADGVGETAKTRINLTVNAALSTANGATYTATYTDKNGKPVTSTNVEVLKVGNGYSLVRINDADRNTKSVTRITVSDGATSAVGIFRNYYTKYDGQADTTWYDMYSSANEFVVASSADLYGLSQLSNTNLISFEGKKIYVVSDIAINTEKLELLENENHLDWYTYDKEMQKEYVDRPTYEWKPIGINKYFKGVFDGQGHTISGMYVRTIRYAGLFGCLGGAVSNGTATIRDLKIKNSHITTSENDAGSVVGTFEGGLIENVYSDAIVTSSNGDSRVGGMVGSVFSTSTMNNCWYAGKIVKTNGQGVGGIVGTIKNGGTLNMTSCLNTATIDTSGITHSTPWAGGLVGMVGNTSSDVARLNVSDSLHAAEIVLGAHQSSGYGGAATAHTKGKIQFNNVYVAGTGRAVFTVASDPYIGSIPSPKKAIETVVGSAASTNAPALGWNSTWKTVAYGTPVLAAFEEEAFDTSWYNENKSVYVIKDKGDLYGFAELSKQNNFAGKTVKLANDIIINTGSAEDWAAGAVPTNKWTPIGSEGEGVVNNFAGTFDGGMHAISGIYHTTSAKYSGLFGGTAAGSTVQNLKLYNSYFKSTAASAHMGSIAGGARGRFDTLYSDAIVVVKGYSAGGIVGSFNGSNDSINNCWFAGKFSNVGTKDTQMHGGIVGNVNGTLTMTNCLNTGTLTTVTGNAPLLGGLIGGWESSTTKNISHSLNVGSIQQTPGRANNYGPIVGSHTGTAPTITKANTFATTESSLYNRYSADTTTLPEQNIIGSAAQTAMSTLDWTNTWTTVDYKTPVLQSFKNENDGRIDVSWYDANATEYTLYDEQDLYGFAMISKNTDFANKKVKLGADIVVNEGTASEEWKNLNYRHWYSIGYAATPTQFAGTFDGQGHSISGLFMNTGNRYAGLFAVTASTGIVQNLRLVNSYITSTNRDMGGLVGLAYGNFYRIYCDVIVEGAANEIGGMIGQMYGAKQEIANCWFAGSVKNTSKTNQDIGGFIGGSFSTTSLTMNNCLYTGVVESAYNHANSGSVAPKVGGFIGSAGANPITMNQCVSLGEIKVDATANNAYGPFIGYTSAFKNKIMSACYTTMDLGEDVNIFNFNNLAVNYNVVDKNDILNDADTQKETMLNLSWGTNWKAGNGTNPELIFDYFASGNGLDYTATPDDLNVLSDQYRERAIYQGEMHNHAYTYGKGQEDEDDILPKPGDDGAKTLTQWKSTMGTLGLDFAASLDHNQLSHYTHPDWEVNKFVYGTEAEATILDDKGKTIGSLHFDMLFKSQEALKRFITSDKYASKFNYSESMDLFLYFGLRFTKSEFKEFIKDIIHAGGMFNLPHPLQNDDYPTTELEDYYFEVKNDTGKYVIYGFQIIKGDFGMGGTTQNHTAWKEMLKKGYRLYATAGSDSHDDLHNEAITSIYATTCKGTKCDGTCGNDDCVGYDKGNLITQLQNGDYSVGNFGIQMCIYEGDNTIAMGGSGNFSTNQRLVISVGDWFTTSRLKTGHTYRLDVVNENGVVYSQFINPSETTTIALDVQDCAYYFVEIYDIDHATGLVHSNLEHLKKYPTGLICAVSNPIWNDAYNWNND